MVGQSISSSEVLDAISKSRVVVAHIDDVGMCHGANLAFDELSRTSFITSGSVMVPCPWFLEAAELAANDPQLDLGVHLTLNSEKHHYRWRPLTGATKSSGLVDDTGYMWPDVPALRRQVAPAAAEAELRAQIDQAIAAGIDVTHLDAHMGAVMLPELVDVYLALGTDYRLPILFPRSFDRYDIKHNLGDVDEAFYQAKAAEAEEAGHLLFDRIFETPWRKTGSPWELYSEMLAEVPTGLSFLALHANAPGEVEVIEPEQAHIRTKEYELFRDPRFVDRVERMGLNLIGFRVIREIYRSRLDD